MLSTMDHCRTKKEENTAIAGMQSDIKRQKCAGERMMRMKMKNRQGLYGLRMQKEKWPEFSVNDIWMMPPFVSCKSLMMRSAFHIRIKMDE
jgi:hypothetical protein